jgi:hypothetical protein
MALSPFSATWRNDVAALFTSISSTIATMVSAASTFGTDNRVLRSDGTGRGAQSSGVRLGDSNELAGVTALTIASNSSSAGLGYDTGAGGTVTQTTSKATAVTLNTMCGLITTDNAALGAGAAVSFDMNNSSVVATDHVIPTINSVGATSYLVSARVTGAGVVSFGLRNVTGGSLSQALVIQFTILRGATS